MDRESVKDLIRVLHDNQNVPMKDDGEWVSTRCPLAPYTHEKGTDNNVSFGIKVEEEEQSRYNCFSCHSSGSLLKLVEEMEEYTGRDLTELKSSVDDLDYLSPFIPEWGSRKRAVNTILDKEPADEDLIELYDSAVGHPYVLGRGISNHTIKYLNLRVDPDNKGEERILFPVYDHHKRFYGFSGRSTDNNTSLRVRDYFGLPKQHLLLGSHLVDKNDEFVVLVEGLFDYAKLWEYNYPGLAVMHSNITVQQVAVLIAIGKPVICMFDDDMAGRDGQEAVRRAVGKHLPLFKVRYPRNKGIRIGRGRSSGAKNDPGGLTKEQVDSMITDRRIL